MYDKTKIPEKSAADHQLSLQLLCKTPLPKSVQLLGFQGETEAKVWAGFHELSLDKRPFEKQLSLHYLFSLVDYATSDPPHSHQRLHIEIPDPHSQRNVNIHFNFKHRNRLNDSQVASSREGLLRTLNSV